MEKKTEVIHLLWKSLIDFRKWKAEIMYRAAGRAHQLMSREDKQILSSSVDDERRSRAHLRAARNRWKGFQAVP